METPRKHIPSQNRSHSLKDLEHEELSGNGEDTEDSSLNYSETDDDEDEGVGDGTMGRTVPDPEEE